MDNSFSSLPKKMNKDNLHLYPKELQDLFSFSEKNRGEILFPEKYFAVQKDHLILKTEELYNKNQNISTIQVLLKIMGTLPDFLPADNIVEVTKIIIDKWEGLKRERMAA